MTKNKVPRRKQIIGKKARGGLPLDANDEIVLVIGPTADPADRSLPFATFSEWNSVADTKAYRDF